MGSIVGMRAAARHPRIAITRAIAACSRPPQPTPGPTVDSHVRLPLRVPRQPPANRPLDETSRTSAIFRSCRWQLILVSSAATRQSRSRCARPTGPRLPRPARKNLERVHPTGLCRSLWRLVAHRMRIMFSGLLASGLLCAGIATAQPCAKPADVFAFAVASLKSKLMVTALTCNQQDRYNDFVQRFRGDLMTQERAPARLLCPRIRWRPRAAGARRLHHQPGEHPFGNRHPAGHVVLPDERRHLR